MRIRAELQAKLSPSAYAELVTAFGGRVLRIPTPRLSEQRRTQVHAALDAGQTYRRAARLLGVSLSTVRRDAKCST